MVKLGPFELSMPVVLAPMAGVTDYPFRTIARRFEAPYCVGEMISAKRELYSSKKTNYRVMNGSEPSPRVVQLVGTEPQLMAEAARLNVDLGAEVIDINMGCPAKKVLKVAAGSALMADERRVEAIVRAVVSVVPVPVSVKIRTGLHRELKNAPQIARIIEEAGADWISIHGRTRACGFKGQAEYNTIKEVVNSVSIPVLANGDIFTPDDVERVLAFTGAKAVMIGRATCGRPWLFAEMKAHFQNEEFTISRETIISTIKAHLSLIYQHYGEYHGVRIARKHIAWYLNTISSMLRIAPESVRTMRSGINAIEAAKLQYKMVIQACEQLFNQSADSMIDHRQAVGAL